MAYIPSWKCGATKLMRFSGDCHIGMCADWLFMYTFHAEVYLDCNKSKIVRVIHAGIELQDYYTFCPLRFLRHNQASTTLIKMLLIFIGLDSQDKLPMKPYSSLSLFEVNIWIGVFLLLTCY